MHLIQPRTRLSAEIELAAAATIRRDSQWTRRSNRRAGADSLLGYGEPGRNSDPLSVSRSTRWRAKGGYHAQQSHRPLHAEFNPSGGRRRTARTARTFWKFVRGQRRSLRARGLRSAARPRLRRRRHHDRRSPIEFGAQIADFVTIKLEGLATRIGPSTVTPFQGCRGALAAVR